MKLPKNASPVREDSAQKLDVSKIVTNFGNIVAGLLLLAIAIGPSLALFAHLVFVLCVPHLLPAWAAVLIVVLAAACALLMIANATGGCANIAVPTLIIFVLLVLLTPIAEKTRNDRLKRQANSSLSLR